jgi:HEAT repeat protein
MPCLVGKPRFPLLLPVPPSGDFMRRLVLLLLVPLSALADPTASSSTEAVQHQVEVYLGAIDTPIPDARWQALGPSAAPLLATIASEDVLPSRRAKALHALSIVDPARAAPLAVRDAGNAQEPLVVRSAAVRAVARTLPASEAVAVLRPVLATADVPLQRRAAEALATVGPEGCAALQAHTGKLSAEAQKPFAQALGRCPTP